MEQVVPKPRKAQILQVYSRRHWKRRILPLYRSRLAAQRLECLVQNKPLPRSNIRLKIQVTQEMWASETPEFQEAVRSETEATYAQSMKEYEEAFKNIPKSGKEYDWYVDARYLYTRTQPDRLPEYVHIGLLSRRTRCYSRWLIWWR